jgi:hypothetical protein
MSIMDFFASQGTASPSPDSETGDWIDWFLNREGPAGRFKGSRRPRYGIDYLFNGGGSVRSRPSNIGYDRAGPTRLERVFQDNTIRSGPDISRDQQLDILRNLQQAPGVTDRAIRDLTPPGEVVIKPRNPGLPPWYNNNIGEGSFWNTGYEVLEDNSGIMSAAMTDSSPDARGNWMINSPTGNKLFSFLVNKFGSEGSADWLKDKGIGGDGGISAFGGNISPDFEIKDDGWSAGITGKWNTPKWLGG